MNVTLMVLLRFLATSSLLLSVTQCEVTNRIGLYSRADSHYTVPKVIDFLRYNTKCSGENEILFGIFRVVSRFLLHFVVYFGNLDYVLDIVGACNFTIRIGLENVHSRGS